MTPQTILVTGGAGFIGSHTAVALTEAGYMPVIVDNLVNSDASVLDRIETITGRRPAFHQEDLRAGTLEWLNIFGNDYPTPDGTGVRDYIHVMDLAEGHVAALKTLESMSAPESELGDALAGKPVPLIVNLGAGRGYSVLEVVRAFEKAAGRKIPYRIACRRPGDIAALYADPSLAHRLLNWRTTRDLDVMCADAWRFMLKT